MTEMFIRENPCKSSYFFPDVKTTYFALADQQKNIIAERTVRYEWDKFKQILLSFSQPIIFCVLLGQIFHLVQ